MSGSTFTLGVYSVGEQIGAGGMGVVYRAHDERLNRDVAIKILPPELAVKAEAVARFEREAQAASALNHPHILHVYDVGQGVDPNGKLVHYIAMELLDGSTLRSRITVPRSDRRTVTWLAQIADALTKAHAAGIIHRDLKPDNIMITADGYAKVLDFGLAKLVEPSLAESDDTTQRVQPQSVSGVLLGTAGYMSPEQAQGRAADQRSDIFSFGCIAYETATSRRAFEGNSFVDTLHKILHEEPRPIESLAPGTPSELRRIIRRCLEKDPDERYQSMKEVAIELRQLERMLGSSGEVMAPAMRRTRRPNVIVTTGVFAIAVAALAGLTVRAYRDRTWKPNMADVRVMRVTNTGRARSVGISGDGNYIAYVEHRAEKCFLMLKHLASDSEIELYSSATLGTAPYRRGDLKPGVIGPRFSQQGNFIYFVDGALYRLPLLGGKPEKVLDAAFTEPSFSPDGRELVVVQQRGDALALVRARLDGDHPAVVLLTKSSIWNPSWSSDGKSIRCLEVPGPDSEQRYISVPLEAPRAIPLIRDPYMMTGAVLPETNGFIVETSTPATPSFWLSHVALSGEKTRLTADNASYVGPTVTRDGSVIAVLRAATSVSLWRVSADGMSARLPMGSDSKDGSAGLHAGADHKIYFSSKSAGSSDVWVTDLDGTSPRRITDDDEDGEFYPTSTRDGSVIIYVKRTTRAGRNVTLSLWRCDADGSHQKQLTSGPNDGFATISPDERSVVYVAEDGIRRMPIDGGASVLLQKGEFGCVAQSSSGEIFARVNAGNQEVRLLAFRSDGSALRTITLKTGGYPGDFYRNFSVVPDGSAVIFPELRDAAENLWLYPLNGAGPHQLTRFSSDLIYQFDPVPDGGFVCARGNETDDVAIVSLEKPAGS